MKYPIICLDVCYFLRGNIVPNTLQSMGSQLTMVITEKNILNGNYRKVSNTTYLLQSLFGSHLEVWLMNFHLLLPYLNINGFYGNSLEQSRRLHMRLQSNLEEPS